MLKVKEVCQRYGVARSTIYRWIDAGLFPKPLRIGEDTVRWRERDLAQFEARAEKRSIGRETKKTG